MEKGKIEFDDPTFRKADNTNNKLRTAAKELDDAQREVRRLRKECVEKGIELPVLKSSDEDR